MTEFLAGFDFFVMLAALRLGPEGGATPDCDACCWLPARRGTRLDPVAALRARE